MNDKVSRHFLRLIYLYNALVTLSCFSAALADQHYDVVGHYIEDAIAKLKLRLHQASQRHEATRLRRSVDQMFRNQSTLPSKSLKLYQTQRISEEQSCREPIFRQRISAAKTVLELDQNMLDTRSSLKIY